MKEWKQVVLQTADAELVCWVENDDRVKPGAFLTLKEMPDISWSVVKVYGYVSKIAPRKTWKVGGLV